MTTLEPFIDTTALTVTADDQVAGATARIREYCRWHVYPSITTTVRRDSGPGRLLLLPSLHVTELGGVTLDEDSSDIDVTGLSAERLLHGCLERPDFLPWLPYLARVTVTFTHGYDTLPDGLREVAVNLAKRMPAQMTTVDREAAGGVSRTYGAPLAGGFTKAGFTAAEQAVCDAYRLPYQP